MAQDRFCAVLKLRDPGIYGNSGGLGKDGEVVAPATRPDRCRGHAQRLKQAGLPAHYSPHSFRATGITNFLENDGTLEAAQRIAGHADSRTTKLNDRRGQKVCSKTWKGFGTDDLKRHS
jgi:integrase